jgi:hypothetical protein
MCRNCGSCESGIPKYCEDLRQSGRCSWLSFWRASKKDPRAPVFAVCKQDEAGELSLLCTSWSSKTIVEPKYSARDLLLKPPPLSTMESRNMAHFELANEFRWVTTPQSKQQTRDRYEDAPDQVE